MDFYYLINWDLIQLPSYLRVFENKNIKIHTHTHKE